MGESRHPPPHRPQDLVLIHGWGMNAAVWESLPSLAMDLRLHPIDLPGHGGRPLLTACDGGPGLLDAWADACLEAAPRGAVWLGWSLGGLVALAAARRVAERRPGRVGEWIRGLILMTATPRFVRAPDWPEAMPMETLAQFHAGLLADPGGTLSRFLALQVRGSDEARETLRGLRQSLATRPPPNARALALGLDLLREQDLRPDLPGLDLPSLWLFGSHDTLVPAAVEPRIRRLAPEARTRVIAGAAHAPFLSHPVATREAIADFLAGLQPRPSPRESEATGAPPRPDSEHHAQGLTTWPNPGT
ncbi:MAG: pimeloyl-ACP methyl ester esterase BioH [Bdellovibrio bacteriovorus]